MTKKLVRSMIVGICMFFVVYFICSTVLRMTETDTKEVFSPIERSADATEEERRPTPDYYMARIEGDSLAVYSCNNGEEEFMYTLDVRLEDIGYEELNRLKNGIMLDDNYDLAAFEEDFTS